MNCLCDPNKSGLCAKCAQGTKADNGNCWCGREYPCLAHGSK